MSNYADDPRDTENCQKLSDRAFIFAHIQQKKF